MAVSVSGPERWGVPLVQRLALLDHVAAFAALSPGERTALAERLREEHYASGATVIAEDDEGGSVYLIADGRAEVTTRGREGPVVLATLEPGELFGELALLHASRRRRATVTATTPLVALALDGAAFTALLATHPDAQAAAAAAAEAMEIARFLKAASPFARLDAGHARLLAERVELLAVPAGADIVREGDGGASCYLLRSGSVEVVAQQDDGERRLATLGPGMLFGETALLTEAPRSATVRATEPCSLLALRRADLLAAMEASPGVSQRVFEMVALRDRPRQAPGVLAQQRSLADGTVLTILKDPQRGAYFRLSPEGWFVWQRLDGEHTLRDLALDYFVAFKAFAPQVIVALLENLVAAGFVGGSSARGAVAPPLNPLSRWQRLLLLARRIMEWRVALPHVDGPLSRLYRGGVGLLFTWVGQLLLGALAVTGLLVFLLTAARVSAALSRGPIPLLWLVIPVFLLSVVVHEAGHAFTTKAFGRVVPRVGFGWYWFSPFVYVDTSDMWLADRWPRIAVDLAGIYAASLLAGLVALLAALVPDPAVMAGLWVGALVSYLVALINLNPLLEYDGYYVLMDLLDRPNLRSRCLRWLSAELPAALWRPRLLWAHRLEVLYGLSSLLYVAAMTALSVVVYRLVVQGWIALLLPAPVAAALAWVLAGGVALLSVSAVLSGLQAPRRRSTSAGR